MMPLISTTLVIGIAMAVADPVVETDNGKIFGTSVTVFNGTSPVDAFLGIPYAVPPVGELRFKPAVAAPPWAPYTMQATQKGAACMQFTPANPLPPWVETENNQSENCLFLNVWRPSLKGNDTNTTKSVMVWIHGGGFDFGSASMNLYDGAVLAAMGDVIVVSMNYRLGVFGFLTLPDDETPVPGNQGLMDQVLALRWVQHHIASFGGDPLKVTLFGESAGGWSIGFHAISPIARSLFHRAIIQSGGVLVGQLADPINVAKRKALQLADSVGCVGGNELSVVHCLQNKSAHHLALMQSIVCSQYLMCFTAVHGDEYLPDDPLKAANVSVPKDFLLGNVENEGAVFASLRFWMQFPFRTALNINKADMLYFFLKTFSFAPSQVAKAVYNLYVGALGDDDYVRLRSELGNAIGDAFLRCPEVFFAEKLSKHGSNIYYYNMVFRSPTAKLLNSGPGMTHFEDVQYVFGMPLRDSPKEQYSKADADFSRQVINIWVTFAKNGIPPPLQDKAWPLFDVQEHKVVSLGNNSTKIEKLRELDRCRFWDNLSKPNLESSLLDCL